MQTLDIGDVELALEVLGGDAAGPDGTLIWGHGLSGSRAHDDALGLLDLGRVADLGRVVRYDARGHGVSGLTTDPDGYSWSALARDQLALADGLGIETYVAGGASMGCGTALHAAVQAPDRIEGLLLVIPPTAWETRRAQVEVWSQLAEIVEAKGVEAFIRGLLDRESPDPFAGRGEWERSFDVQRQTSVERLATVLRGAGKADLPDRDAIAALGQPTLVLAWSGDLGHPTSTAEELVSLMPNAELSIASTFEELGTWTDRTTAFLGGL